MISVYWFIFSILYFSKAQDWLYSENIVKIGNLEFVVYSQIFQMDKCFNQKEQNTRALIDNEKYVIITVENGYMTYNLYEDENCQNYVGRIRPYQIGVDYQSYFFESTSEYLAIQRARVGQAPSLPSQKEGTYASINVFQTETCTDEIGQRFLIQSHKCAFNWVAFGDPNHVDYMTHVMCDANELFNVVYDQLGCDEDRIVYYNYFNLQIINFAQSQFDFVFCFEHPVLKSYINFECKDESDPEFVEFTSEAKYMTHDLYYNTAGLETIDRCIGEPTLKITYELDTCTGNQLVHSNKSHYSHRVYDTNDVNCEEKPISILYANMLRLSANEDDPFCSKMWIYKLDQYYRKPVFFNDYDLHDFSYQMALIPNVDCANFDQETIDTYKYRPAQAFYYASDDFCFSDAYMFTYVNENNLEISFKGYCEDGKLQIKQYTTSKYCKNLFFYFNANQNSSYNGICTNNFYITCLSYVCYGYEIDDLNICSGHGSCIDFDTCLCDSGFTGHNCSLTSIDYSFLFIIIPSFTFIFLLFFCIIVISLIIIFVILLNIKSQKKKIQEFEDIEDIDILLQESKIEKQQDPNYIGKSLNRIKLTTKSFEIPFESIILEKEIGSGGSGSTIFLAKWNSKEVAFKVFKTFFSTQAYYEEFDREVQFAMELRHPHILQFYGCCINENPPKVGILMEFCKFGSLKDYFNKLNYKNMKIPFQEKLRFLIEIATGLQYLHEKNVIHRDIKSDNILVDKTKSSKIMDFGLSKKIFAGEEDKTMTRQIGTSFYMAPEVYFSNQYTYKVDMFSYAIVMWEIFYVNFTPYGKQSYSIQGLEMKVSKDPNFRPSINALDFAKYPNFFEIMQQGWLTDPEKRPEWKIVIENLKQLQKKAKKEDLLNFSKKLKNKITQEKRIETLKKILKNAENHYSMKKNGFEKEIEQLKHRIKNNNK